MNLLQHLIGKLYACIKAGVDEMHGIGIVDNTRRYS